MSLQVPPGEAERNGGEKLVSPLVSARSRTPQRQSDLMEPWMMRSQTPPARPEASLMYMRQPAYFPSRESVPAVPSNSVQRMSPVPVAPVPVLTSPPAIVQRYMATSPTRIGVTSPVRFVGEWQRRVQPTTTFWFQPPYVARQSAPPAGQMPGPGPISEPVGSRYPDPTTGPGPPAQDVLSSSFSDRRSSFREGC